MLIRMMSVRSYVILFFYFLLTNRHSRRFLKYFLIPVVSLELYWRFKRIGHWVGFGEICSHVGSRLSTGWNWISDAGKNNSSAIGTLVGLIGLIGLYLNVRHNRATRRREQEVYNAGQTPRILTRIHKDHRKGEDVFTVFNVGGGPAVDVKFSLQELMNYKPGQSDEDEEWETFHKEYIPILEKSGTSHKEFTILSRAERREVLLRIDYADTLGRFYKAHQWAGANPGDDISLGNFDVENVTSLKCMKFREKVLHIFVFQSSKALWRVGAFLKANHIHSFSQLAIQAGYFVYIFRKQKAEEEKERLTALTNDDSD